MAATQNGPELHLTTLELAQGANFGVITTAIPSGKLQNHLIWIVPSRQTVVGSGENEGHPASW